MLLGCILPSKSAFSASAPPAPASPPALAISQIKITGDEFVVLRNNSGKDITDLSSYWLDDFNNNQPMSAGASRSTQQLPAAKLANGQTLLLSSNGMAACGAAVAGKLSVSLTDGGGFLQVVQVSQSPLGIIQMPIDYVSWSSGTDPLIPNVPSSTKSPRAVYYRYANSTGFAWQLADLDTANPCQLNVAGSTSVSSGLTAAVSPVPSVKGVSTASLSIPDSDVGLAAPQISEVLPNPASPQTDAEDEFIELYNFNNNSFDLSGFILQVGTTTVHKYTFPDGTHMDPHQFMAFQSLDTGLSLSNSSGQVKLLDPGGNLLSQTDEYGTAKDGYSWVSADGLWQWTTTPTPNAVNIITTPPLSKTAVKGTATAKKTKTASSKSSSKAPAAASSAPAAKPPAGLHPGVLAGIGSLAVVYGLYEYRYDLANQLIRLRRYRAARRIAG